MVIDSFADHSFRLLTLQIFEAIQPAYITTDSKEAAWVGKGPGDAEGVEGKPRLLKTAKGGVCYTKTFVGASLS